MTLQRCFRDDSGISAQDLADQAAAVPYLVIDDLGVEKSTDYVKQLTYFIINFRESNLLPTYITTNLPPDQLEKIIDQRIASRIAGMCELIRMDGPDQRIGS